MAHAVSIPRKKEKNERMNESILKIFPRCRFELCSEAPSKCLPEVLKTFTRRIVGCVF